MTYHAKLQEKVYFESVHGKMIKARYIGYTLDFPRRIAIQITARTDRVYRYGEILYAAPSFVIPRACYHQTGNQSYIITPYEYDEH